MSSTAKQLKAVRELVKRKQWDDVLEQTQAIVKDDPKSSHAYVGPEYRNIVMMNTNLLYL